MTCKGFKTPNIGEMRHRITIQNKVLSTDSMGGYTETYTTFATMWASIEPRLGNEFYKGHRLEENVSHVIRVRYYAGIEPTMRISFDSRIFQIKSVIKEHEVKEFITILAMEGVGE